MDPILYVFGVLAAAAAAQAGLEWWRGRSWAAALYAVLAAVAATPFTVGLPDGVIVAGLLVLVAVVGFLLWPRAHREQDPDDQDGPGCDDDHAPDVPGAGRDGRGRS